MRERSAFTAAVLVHLVVLYWPWTAASGGPPVDKVVHVMIFAAVLLTGAWCGLPRLPLTVILLAHAGLSELIQGAALPGRAADPYDALADVLGILLALALLQRRPRRGPAAG